MNRTFKRERQKFIYLYFKHMLQAYADHDEIFTWNRHHECRMRLRGWSHDFLLTNPRRRTAAILNFVKMLTLYTRYLHTISYKDVTRGRLWTTASRCRLSVVQCIVENSASYSFQFLLRYYSAAVYCLVLVHSKLVTDNNTSALRCGVFGVQLNQFTGGDIQRTRQLFTASRRHIGPRIAMSRDICQTRSE